MLSSRAASSSAWKIRRGLSGFFCRFLGSISSTVAGVGIGVPSCTLHFCESRATDEYGFRGLCPARFISGESGDSRDLPIVNTAIQIADIPVIRICYQDIRTLVYQKLRQLGQSNLIFPREQILIPVDKPIHVMGSDIWRIKKHEVILFDALANFLE